MVKDLETEKRLAAKEAVKLIGSDCIIGLGTGSTAAYAVWELGEAVKNGLKIRAVPTSDATARLAESLNIPLVDINTVDSIDVTIDGADEFNSDLVLIKGGGGALLREKIVASMTREEIIITDSTKKVDVLGKFKLPDEGNYIIDADFGEVTNPVRLSGKLSEIEGVAAHGLFINLASKVIMGTGNGTEIFKAKQKYY